MGRGLDALMPSSSKEDGEEKDLLMLDPHILKPNPYQPRRVFDEIALNELASSIKVHGLIQPVIAQKDIDGSYFIIAGERRTRASIIAGLNKIPVVLKAINEQSKLEVALIENIQRENLNPIEEAKAYQKIISMGNLTQEELSLRIGKSRPTITNFLRLLQLSPEMQDALKEGKITTGHAKALLGIEEEVKRREVFKEIIENHLSVRETELKSSNIAKEKKKEKKESKTSVKKNELKDIQEQFIAKLGTKVEIKGSLESGIIEIAYFSKDALNSLYDAIIGKNNEV